MKFRFGIEHEVAFEQPGGLFSDFSNTKFEALDQIVSTLPTYVGDYPQLRIGDAGIKQKRWYIEGYERFDERGQLTGCTPKGIEMRTTIHESIDGAVAELGESFSMLKQASKDAGFIPLLVSYNPFQRTFLPDPPLNTYEEARRVSSPEKQSAYIPMMTQGPDLNMSVEGLRTGALIDFGCKLTYYSPYIIPFTFSSPFSEGKLWKGMSLRNFVRTGVRPAVLVFLEHKQDLIKSVPSLTKPARLASEIGRIEFKSCDSCGDFQIYGAILALMKGLLLDHTLKGRSVTPDARLHQQSARYGFDHPEVEKGSLRVLEAAHAALDNDADQCKLALLFAMLAQKDCLAKHMIQQFRSGVAILRILRQSYGWRVR